MKLFENRPQVEREEPKPVDPSFFAKRNLMKSVDRSEMVRKAVEDWLMSFEGGITRKLFDHQMKRLSFDDDLALTQLQRAMGSRTIPLPPPPKNPPLTKSLVAQMLEDTYVAVHGRGFRPVIKQAIHELRACGTVYVLEVEELILQFKTYEDKGNSPQMIDQAIEADFLIVVNLEMPIHIEWHIREAIERIGRRRELEHKPIISTWNRFNDVNEFFKRFKIYEV